MLPDLARAQLLERQGRSIVRARPNTGSALRELGGTPRLREWSLLQRAQSIESNDPTRALKLYDRLVRESIDGRYAVEAQLARAHLLRRVGRPDEALRVYEREGFTLCWLRRPMPERPNCASASGVYAKN